MCASQHGFTVHLRLFTTHRGAGVNNLASFHNTKFVFTFNEMSVHVSVLSLQAAPKGNTLA